MEPKITVVMMGRVGELSGYNSVGLSRGQAALDLLLTMRRVLIILAPSWALTSTQRFASEEKEGKPRHATKDRRRASWTGQ